ncbi:MAG: hypothetical protein ACYTGH_16465 [Planctomycetota bacterium]|jgi:hypothetical protein
MVAYEDKTFDNVVFDNVELEGRVGLRILNARNWDLRGLTSVRCAGGPPIEVRDSVNVLLPDWFDPTAAYPPEVAPDKEAKVPPYHEHCGFS